MSTSDVLHPDGNDYDSFLFSDVGVDKSGDAVTVLSALARLGLEPWTEARELARLGRDAAQVRLKAHLSAITDIPSLGPASGSVATTLVALLPKHKSRRIPDATSAQEPVAPRIPLVWLVMALFGVLVLLRVYYLAQWS